MNIDQFIDEQIESNTEDSFNRYLDSTKFLSKRTAIKKEASEQKLTEKKKKRKKARTFAYSM